MCFLHIYLGYFVHFNSLTMIKKNKRWLYEGLWCEVLPGGVINIRRDVSPRFVSHGVLLQWPFRTAQIVQYEGAIRCKTNSWTTVHIASSSTSNQQLNVSKLLYFFCLKKSYLLYRFHKHEQINRWHLRLLISGHWGNVIMLTMRTLHENRPDCNLNRSTVRHMTVLCLKLTNISRKVFLKRLDKFSNKQIKTNKMRWRFEKTQMAVVRLACWFLTNLNVSATRKY